MQAPVGDQAAVCQEGAGTSAVPSMAVTVSAGTVGPPRHSPVSPPDPSLAGATSAPAVPWTSLWACTTSRSGLRTRLAASASDQPGAPKQQNLGFNTSLPQHGISGSSNIYPQGVKVRGDQVAGAPRPLSWPQPLAPGLFWLLVKNAGRPGRLTDLRLQRESHTFVQFPGATLHSRKGVGRARPPPTE